MLPFYFHKYQFFVYGTGIAVLLLMGVFLFLLQPVQGGDIVPKEIIIERGDGLHEIAARLKAQNLIRSPLVFEFLAMATFRAHLLKPGDYAFSTALSTPKLISHLVLGGRDEVTVVIPEGWSVKEIDELLSKAKIIREGDLMALAAKEKLEGYLFPDTYRFYAGSDINTVVEKFRENFKAKIGMLIGSGEVARRTLTLASLLEKEVPAMNDRKIIAGILLKRLSADWPLQVDASICYIKSLRQSTSTMRTSGEPQSNSSTPNGSPRPDFGRESQSNELGTKAGQAGKCYPLIPLDFKIDSPYNTYLYKGLPPSPIANPGLDAIDSALHPVPSPYWFYLSDPKTHKTFFSETLEEQTKNKRLILP
ncbi:MAG: endolytic transglycosylase MltG [bacterium]|nr:endolytic transglycosylase MltG [bacterium]